MLNQSACNAHTHYVRTDTYCLRTDTARYLLQLCHVIFIDFFNMGFQLVRGYGLQEISDREFDLKILT